MDTTEEYRWAPPFEAEMKKFGSEFASVFDEHRLGNHPFIFGARRPSLGSGLRVEWRCLPKRGAGLLFCRATSVQHFESEMFNDLIWPSSLFACFPCPRVPLLSSVRLVS